jgi:hypothetical protein
MQSLDVASTIAEIAVGLAGFSGRSRVPATSRGPSIRSNTASPPFSKDTLAVVNRR